MKEGWIGVLAAALLLVFLVADANAGADPPVSQPLVKEGDLAVGLAQGLLNGAIADEIEAETELASIGIAPRNGWISDYPVTPDIIVELRENAVNVADSGKLLMSGGDASVAVDNVCAGMGFYV